MSETVETLPAGTYVIGDPCYAFPGRLWSELLSANGCFDEKPMVEFEGITVLGLETMFGDGVYLGSDGFSYCVDSGLIGAVSATPEVLAHEFRERLGTLVTFETDVRASRSVDGTITIGHIIIKTGDEEEDWDDQETSEAEASV